MAAQGSLHKEDNTMARLFTGNYGSALGNYGQAAQLQAQAGANIGQALQSVGTSIAGALEKYEANKKKKEREEAARLGITNFVEANPKEAERFLPTDPDKRRVAIDAMSKNPEATQQLLQFAQFAQQSRLKSEEGARAEKLHIPGLSKAISDAKIAQIKLEAEPFLSDMNMQLKNLQLDDANRQNIMNEAELAAYGGAEKWGQFQKQLKEIDKTGKLTDIGIQLGDFLRREKLFPGQKEQAAATLEQTRARTEATKLTTQQAKELFPYQVQEAKAKEFLDQNQIAQIKENQNVKRILAGEQGAWSPIELDRAKEENMQRNRAKKQFEQEFKKGKFEIKRLESLIENAGDAGTSQQERLISRLLKDGKIDEKKASEIRLGWVLKNAGLEELSKKDQYKYLGESIGVGLVNLKTIDALLNAGEVGSYINGEPVSVKTDKKGDKIITYTNKGGDRNKVPVSREVQDRVEVYQNFWGEDLGVKGNMESEEDDLIAGQTDEELDKVIEEIF